MPEYEMIRCDTHGIDIPKVSKSYAEAHGLQYGCQQCRDDLAGRPPAEAMSREDRAKEMHEVLNAHCMAGFDAVWDRVNVLVGRSTYTHELAYPDHLEHEIMTGSVPSTEGIIAKLPHDKPVYVVMAEGADGDDA